LSSIRVLVVDDSRETREFVARYVLEPNGFESLEAASGAEALRQMLKGGIDLMLLDLEMPSMTGFEVLNDLRVQYSGIPVVLMTSHEAKAINADVFCKGVRDCVVKPFTAEDMLTAIKRALAEVQLQREKEALATQLANTEREVERRSRALDALSQIGESAVLLTERDELLGQIVEAALCATEAEEGALFLISEPGGVLREGARKRGVEGEGKRISRRTEAQLAVDAVRKGDVTTTRAMICTPLKIGTRSVGALGVSNRVTGRSFSDHDRRMLVAVADYAAVVLENTRLLQRTERIRREFEHYVAPSVVKRLMTQPGARALGGVRQRVTVLFADIRGFSDFSVRATPEVLVNVLNRHLGVAAEAVLAEDGTPDKFLGDAVMALFNAPFPQPDHALKAVRAAWRMCQAIDESHADLPSASQLQFGVGISTGEALVGNIGAPQLMSFTAVGDAVNVSRRLQMHALGGQILICQQTYSLVQDYVGARAVGVIEVKGHPQPEPAFEVLSV
jgi:class 3 adenylate cyclase/CheY-like chemotaxis protein